MPNYNLEELSSEVDTVISRIMTSMPFGTRRDQYNQFIIFRQQIEELEDNIDMLEDRVKADYRAGKITRAEYRNTDRLLDSLEDRLDRAEDYLERIFRVDD